MLLGSFLQHPTWFSSEHPSYTAFLFHFFFPCFPFQLHFSSGNVPHPTLPKPQHQHTGCFNGTIASCHAFRISCCPVWPGRLPGTCCGTGGRTCPPAWLCSTQDGEASSWQLVSHNCSKWDLPRAVHAETLHNHPLKNVAVLGIRILRRCLESLAKEM